MGDIAASKNYYTPEFNKCQEGVKTYPDLSAHCIKERLDLSLRLWYLCRQAAPRGWLPIEDVYHVSVGTQRETRRWLTNGEGVFWHIADDRLYLHGLGKVCVALGVKPVRSPVALSLSEIENLGRFRAALFASWLAGAPKTVSQKLLGQIFGRKPKTIYRWCKLAGVKVQQNTVWSHIPSEEALKTYPVGALSALGLSTVEEETAGEKVTAWLECWTAWPYKESWQYRKGRKVGLCWYFVNTYSVEVEREPKTRLQRQAARGMKTAKPSDGLGSNPARPPVKGRFLHPRFPPTDDKLTFAARLRKRKEGVAKSLRKNGFAIVQGLTNHHGRMMWEFQTLA